VFEHALATLREGGAEVVEIKEGPSLPDISAAELIVLLAEFKDGLNAYLAMTAPERVGTRTLADVITFNRQVLALFGQDIFEKAESTNGVNPAYREAASKARRLAGPEGIDALDAIVAPTGSPAWTSDTVLGDHFLGSASELAAVAGYPHITVPMGFVRGLPVGLSIFGPAWSDAKLIGIAYAFEQRALARRAPSYPPTLPE
jgi:amidase